MSLKSPCSDRNSVLNFIQYDSPTELTRGPEGEPDPPTPGLAYDILRFQTRRRSSRNPTITTENSVSKIKREEEIKTKIVATKEGGRERIGRDTEMFRKREKKVRKTYLDRFRYQHIDIEQC